ncbi:hypothetical protein [Nocardia goodfellowii]|uniref:AB hydrolase-1 domain-containing protein n=1 Tax=Nocardia goodfellowii TaxID=882446 RepID=A0ABS4QGE9_9NOCA|nr:hypothetical protein [Nocardia goodfellowii]MBP2190164.1 hypothetical protein [Nocardia goodfellowii]
MVAATSLLLIAGCAGATPDEGESANAAGLDQFMEQELEFGPCDSTIVNSQAPVPEVIEAAKKTECATLEVPMDYENLDDETIDIAVTRHAATGDDRIGSVVLNPGGPGSQATTFAPLVAALWTGGPLTERFDIVGFDPRGVGNVLSRSRSHPPTERSAECTFARLSESPSVLYRCLDGRIGCSRLAELGQA